MQPYVGDLQLCHSLPGRSRFRISTIRRNSEAANRLEAWMRRCGAVHSAYANSLTGTLLVYYNSQALALPELERQLRTVLVDGLPPAPVARPVAESSVARPMWRFLGLTGVMGAVLVRQFVFKLPVAQAAFSPFGFLVMLASLPLLRRSFEQFREDQPVSLESFLGGTTLVAVVAGEAATALEVLWIHSGAAWLTAWITERSRREITQIVQLSDREACKLVEGAEVRVPVEALSIGDLVMIHADEKIPVDGRIENSEALVDESPITGRAELVLRQPGDQVFAGTLVQQGSLQVRAEQVGNATYLARIFQLVEDSLENKAPIEGVADQLARTLVNVGFVATAGTLLVTGSLWNAFTVMLVMACPCATALAASTAISAALSTAARRHILIKGGRYLEEIGKAEVVCFDKTGTLTTGRAAVERIVGVGEVSETELLAWAIWAESSSHHPLAVALGAEAESRGLTAAAPALTEAFLGMGVRAVEDGHEILLGNRKLMERFAVEDPAASVGSESQPPDRTLVYLAKDGQLVGRFELTQQVRDEAPAVIAQLKTAGVGQTILLTGDEEAVAQPLAQKLGLGRTFASVTPEAKAALVSELGQNGQTVVMVGDGINDALALAEADVGIAMGAGGSPVAIEAADIALVRDDLRGLVYTHTLSRATLDVVHQNFWIATGSNVFGLLLGVAGRLTPMTAGLIHIVHTLGVLANSSRLLRDEHED